MRNVHTLLTEWFRLTIWTGFTLAALTTNSAADFFISNESLPFNRIHFTLYSLVGYLVLSAFLCLVGAIVTWVAGFFLKADEPATVRQWIQTVALGTCLILIWPASQVALVQNLTPSISPFLNFLVIALIFYLVAAVVSFNCLKILHGRSERAQWSINRGFWLFMVLVLPIGIISYPPLLKVITVIAGLALIIFLLPRIHDWLNQGSIYKKGIPAIILLILIISTRPSLPQLPDGVPQNPDEPSIVMITVETLRPEALDCYPEGAFPRLGTPNINRIADEGTLFENAIATSSWTMPSVGSYISGLPPEVHGAFDQMTVMTQSATTIAEILREDDYITSANLVNWLLNNGSGMNQGFDIFREYMTNQNLNKKLLFLRVWENVYSFLKDSRLRDDYDFDIDAVDHAVKFIESNADRKFFLWLHLFSPHGDYDPPDEYRERIVNELGIPALPKSEIPYLAYKRGEWNITGERLELQMGLYAGEVAFMDYNTGLILEALERAGILDETIVLFFADHGEEFFEHDRAEHGRTLYPETIKVPLIVRWPGRIPAGQRISQWVSLVDIPPTILDLAGVEAALDGSPALFTGRSFSPMFSNDEMPVMPIFSDRPSTFDKNLKAVIYDGLLYIGGSKMVNHPRLFDLNTDPMAWYDILPERPSDTELLSAMLDEYELLCDELKDAMGETDPVDRTEIFRSIGYLN